MAYCREEGYNIIYWNSRVGVFTGINCSMESNTNFPLGEVLPCHLYVQIQCFSWLFSPAQDQQVLTQKWTELSWPSTYLYFSLLFFYFPSLLPRPLWQRRLALTHNPLGAGRCLPRLAIQVCLRRIESSQLGERFEEFRETAEAEAAAKPFCGLTVCVSVCWCVIVSNAIPDSWLN